MKNKSINPTIEEQQDYNEEFRQQVIGVWLLVLIMTLTLTYYFVDKYFI